MPLSYVSRELIRELDRLEPFGPGNVKPVFAQKNIRLLEGTVMGKNKNVGKYTVADPEGRKYETVFFGDLQAFHSFLEHKYSREQVDRFYAGAYGRGTPQSAGTQSADAEARTCMEISMAYYPGIHTYMGRESIQIVMLHYC
jgi:single-stranded-DNA-specific exonuclease